MSCNTPRETDGTGEAKRPQNRVKSKGLSGIDGTLDCVLKVAVRGLRHDENVTEFDGTEWLRNESCRFVMTFSELVISGGNHVHELCNSLLNVPLQAFLTSDLH